MCGLGGGDIKLIATLVIFCLPQNLLLTFVAGFTTLAFITAFICTLRYRNLRIAIPLAPAISGGYLWAVGL